MVVGRFLFRGGYCSVWTKGGEMLILKGGGYGGGLFHHTPIGGSVTRLRHHWWTGTTDLPRSKVPPSDGGLEKPPSRWRRLVNWSKFIVKQLRKEWEMWRVRKTIKED